MSYIIQNLAENRLGSEGAAALCDMLEYNIDITVLNLSGQFSLYLV